MDEIYGKLDMESKEIERMERDKKEAEAELQSGNKEISGLKSILDRAKAELNGAENERIKLNNNINNSNEQMDKIATNIKNKTKEKEVLNLILYYLI